MVGWLLGRGITVRLQGGAEVCPSVPSSGRCCRFNPSHVVLLRSVGGIIVSQVMAQSSQKKNTVVITIIDSLVCFA